MALSLDALVARWRGSRVSFDITVGDKATQTAEGILDGPYLGDDPGVLFVVGGRVIEGNIAVDGLSVEIDLDPRGESALLTPGYVELQARELPADIDIADDRDATWSCSLTDGRTARARLTLI
jgi:hypothetical protein